MSRLLALLAASGCLAVMLCSVANASVTHILEGTFNGSDGPEGAFGVVLADAVDRSGGASNGDIYVGEFGAVEKFKADGTYAGVRITGSETPDGSLGLLSGNVGRIAVDGSPGPNSGDLYIADIEHDVVDKYSEAGVFICQITGRTTPSEKECAGTSGSATPSGSMSPTGVAVDSGSGELWVADAADGVVNEFNPSGEWVGQVADSHLTSPGAIALDGAGHLFVVNEFPLFFGMSGGNVVAFHNGAFERTFDSEGPAGLAVDPANNHLYVFNVRESSAPKGVVEYDAAGNVLDEFGGGSGEIGDAESIAVASNGQVLATNLLGSPGGYILKYSPDVTVPTTTTQTASEVTETSARLSADVDPDLGHGGTDVTTCEFEYVTKQAYEAHSGDRFEGASHAPCTPAPPYSAVEHVTAALAGLSASTDYEYRVVASNANKVKSYGQALGFATVGPPVITNEASNAMFANAATLSAKIASAGFDTMCELQFVTDAQFEKSGYAAATTVPCVPAAIGHEITDATPVSVHVGGLLLATTYHYRFVASNAAGETDGEDAAFDTFGIKSFSFAALDREGQPFTQAGGHPYEWAVKFTLNTTVEIENLKEAKPADGNVRTVETTLPAGFIANPTATARCPRYQVALDQCSPGSQVGELSVENGTNEVFTVGLYNVVPPAGVPVELGAVVLNLVRVYIDGNVSAASGYRAIAKVDSASAADNIRASTVKIWGVPEDPSHNSRRVCPVPGEQISIGAGECPPAGPVTPLLTNPTSCPGAPLVASMRVDSWQAPDQYVTAKSEIPATTGCGALDFTPSIGLAPDTTVADSPSGLDVNLEVPQNEAPAGLATSALENTSVQLPVGVSISPAAANGLDACSEEEIGLHSEAEPTCPDASKIGTVEIVSPLLVDHLTGGVYVAKQGENPFGSLFAMYIAAEADGARVKLAGHVVADPVTGQLTTTFDETPQLPFSDLKLHLFGGRRGVLATPESCGTFTSVVGLSPWDGLGATVLKPTFPVKTGCVSGFKPTFTAGTVNTQAGANTSFALSLGRSDGEEDMSGLSVKLPLGVLGNLSTVPLCGEAQASTASCPASSQIGTVLASAGPGEALLSLPGHMYLTGPYKGAPFGEEVVVPAIAGPFNLGNVVVRGTIQVDPHNAEVTVTSDPFPQIVQGVPVHLRRIHVNVDRAGFMLNPTSCAVSAVNATASSTGGAGAALSSRFQVGGCGELAFKPGFKVATSAKTSRIDGASLHVLLTYPKDGLGKDANVKSVHVELPRALPSRLSTLNHACTEAVFNQNPGNCPAQSKVGYARALTPILPVPLEGPAYFVSHGGQKFPELIVVLQGYGLTIDLAGETFISKAGVTSSTFNTVPDVPVSSFELTLPEGPFSALAANRDLCTTSLAMPTTFTGQNGAVFKQSTKIAVTGCKPAIHVLGHNVKGAHASIRVSVPSAGTLVASGKGIGRSVKRVGGAGVVTVGVTLSGRDLRVLAKNPNQRVNATVQLRFKPRHGAALTAHVRLLMG